MSTKHTPGPWKTLKFEDNENYVVTNQSGRPGFHREIATVHFGFSEPAETEQHANAKLIAAAPELLEKLDQLTLVVGLTAFKHEDQRAVLQQALDEARAAVAKATT